MHPFDRMIFNLDIDIEGNLPRDVVARYAYIFVRFFRSISVFVHPAHRLN